MEPQSFFTRPRPDVRQVTFSSRISTGLHEATPKRSCFPRPRRGGPGSRRGINRNPEEGCLGECTYGVLRKFGECMLCFVVWDGML